jgi:hypothetical protein
VTWFRRRQRAPIPAPPRRSPDEQPDVEKARADLARIQSRRSNVEAVVAALIIEQHLNNFSANLTATLRGGRL